MVLSSFGCGKNDSPSTQSFCRSISELQLNDALSLDISTNDDAKVRLAIRQTANLMTKVLEETPNNNQKDAAIISAFINALADAVSNSDFDSPLERAAISKPSRANGVLRPNKPPSTSDKALNFSKYSLV